MTTAQLQTLKTDITVTRASVSFQGQTLLQHWNQDHTQIIADFYNQVAAGPAVSLWKPDVPVEDLAKSILMSEFIALTAVKQNGFAVYQFGTYVDATNANVRNGFNSIFGTSTSLTNLTAIAKKPGTYLEVLFSSVDGAANTSTLYKYTLTAADVDAAKLV
jgi:hypothetical protein